MKYQLSTPLAFLVTGAALSAATAVVTDIEGTSAASVPTDPVVSGSVAVIARQVPTITVTGAINKADHDDDSAEFRSGVGSLFTKATSAIGDALKPDPTSTGAATTTTTGTNAAGQVAIPGRDGVGMRVAVMMVGLAGLIGAGMVL